MNFFEHHIGDYAAATAHLSLVEDAIYSRMLRRYYLTEEPLPADWRQVARFVGARSDDELAAVRAILAEFFTMGDDGYRQKRADEVIAEFHQWQSDKDEGRANEAERKRRYRDRRADLFKQLREIGIVPEFDTPTDELVRMLSHGTRRGQDGDGTATHYPLPTTQVKAKALVQRSAARFEEFWAAYPEKKGKAAAMKAWKAKGCDAIADDILAHVQRMRAHDRAWREGFIPHGSTYVNGERWHDEPKQAQPRAGTEPAPSKTLSAIQQLEGMKRGLADTRNHNGLPETALPQLGPDPGD